MKTKTIITAALMGIGLGLALLEMKVQQPSGVVLLITGAMFGSALVSSGLLVQDDSCGWPLLSQLQVAGVCGAY